MGWVTGIYCEGDDCPVSFYDPFLDCVELIAVYLELIPDDIETKGNTEAS